MFSERLERFSPDKKAAESSSAAFLFMALEHLAFEQGKMQGNGTAPPGQNQAEKPCFFHETPSVSI
ncbi:MAG TPA: hypothetical protein H9774_12480 [Candidatus Desulfovibrio gallistercoris]|uniref:hypothetical protein n=1 Tax=uncultured Desulfovibrio sp. TaxID=167968 RepID=UPI001F95F314|nr:hypothetical protein [uncultured Desulfovibrio sp.]HJA77651.1 hypothetical protein [Candidatus Desulfovibrio gallistercoris]